MEPTPSPAVAGSRPKADPQRIGGIDLIVADLDRAVAFYTGLGFSAEATDGNPRRTLVFGDFTLGLTAASRDVRTYPAPRTANDPWFQHFCIAVADMPRAHAQLEALGATPITSGGPQLLPPNTGSVVAYKFRDPDGHPLELSFIPGGDWLREARLGDIFLGVDHTAIAVADLAASIAFYQRLGFAINGQSLNTGAEQDRLDGLADVAVDIVALSLGTGGPHLELLHYRTPAPASVLAIAKEDIAATRTILDSRVRDARPIRDPDGHIIMTTSAAGQIRPTVEHP